ncbi:cation:proton antiporter [Undibacterium sp. TJN19]|uniref:cation:proton antiporter domain-containing protein n=1 Tax=Undibacterium sp. TJN19 TaxID=3413055 RepID=UPI003BF0D57D
MLENPVLIQVAVILCTARLVGFVLRRFGQPSVVSEMFAGLMLGPGIFGAIAPELHSQLFATSSLAGLQGLVQLGVVLFMFIVGLELRLPVGAKPMLIAASSIGVLSVLFPLGLGLAIAPVLYERFAPANVAFWPFSAFISVAFSITAFPVLARILKDRSIAHTSLGQLALSSAAIADLLAWVLVGMVVIFASANADWNRATQLVTGLAVMILVLFGIVRPLIARLLPASGQPGNVLFTFILIGVFVAGYVAKSIHIDEVFGAFLFGLCLPRDDRLLHWFSERIEPVAVVVLLPVFFALSGLKTTASAFTGQTVGIFAMILLTAVIGKMTGAFLGARLAGCPTRLALSVGALMNARGLMELIVLKVGLDAGLIGPELFTMFLVMAIVTTVMAGPLLTLFGRQSTSVVLAVAEN